MIEKAHNKYHKGEMILRDYLAAHRTFLSNERTWLGSLRTSLTLFVAGVTFIKFFDSQILTIVGWIFIPLGVIYIILGIHRYFKVRNMIHSIKYNKKRIKKI